MSRSLAQKRRRVEAIQKYWHRYLPPLPKEPGEFIPNIVTVTGSITRAYNVRARELAHRFRRRYGRHPWEGPNFGILSQEEKERGRKWQP